MNDPSAFARGATRNESPSGDEPTKAYAERYKDVWSRAGSRYRVRAAGLLLVNLILFAGVGSFAFWLRSGEVFAPATQGYWESLLAALRFGSASTISLGTLLTEPISVQQTEMQIWVVGLLMAALIAIPILISLLYRFWSSLPFVAVVGFLAVMPWLAITLLASCLIASVRPFRSRYRFMSAMFGLVPAVVYLILAFSGTNDVLVGVVDPVDRIKFVAPWVLAIVAATAVFALVLIIAQFVDYRPGTVAPLLAVLFVLPVALFENYVGRDTLYYRLLESSARASFRDVDASQPLEAFVEQEWLRHPLPRPARQAIRERTEIAWLFALSDLSQQRSVILEQQMDFVDKCDEFVYYFPESRFAYHALFLKARALDLRIDEEEFRRTKWIRFYDGFPREASRSTWEIIALNRPDTMLGAVAALRLAELEARDCDIDRALSRLDELAQRFGGRIDAERVLTAPVADGIADWRIDPQDAAAAGFLPIDADRVLLDAMRLRDLLRNNRDPIYGYDPICGGQIWSRGPRFGMLDCIPRHPSYRDQLKTLMKAYPNAQAQDNLALESAKALPAGAQKVTLLEECLRRFPNGDAAAEALFRLGVTQRVLGRTSEAERSFGRLLAEHAKSIWAGESIRFGVDPMRVAARLTEGERR